MFCLLMSAVYVVIVDCSQFPTSEACHARNRPCHWSGRREDSLRLESELSIRNLCCPSIRDSQGRRIFLRTVHFYPRGGVHCLMVRIFYLIYKRSLTFLSDWLCNAINVKRHVLSSRSILMTSALRHGFLIRCRRLVERTTPIFSYLRCGSDSNKLPGNDYSIFEITVRILVFNISFSAHSFTSDLIQHRTPFQIFLHAIDGFLDQA